MKNREVIAGLSNINRFMAREVENNKPFISTQAKFILRKNLKALKSIYSLYEECLQDIIKKYNIDAPNGIINIKEDTPNGKDIQKEITELMDVESEINIEKISINDFSEDCLLGDMELLDFMTEEE